MGKSAQAAVNGIGGYVAGRMKGSNNSRSPKQRAADMEDYKNALDIHAGYSERLANHHETVRQRATEHAAGIAERLQNVAHGLGMEMETHRSLLATDLEQVRHQLGESAAQSEFQRRQTEQSSLHHNALDLATHNANLNRDQMHAAADLVPQLRDTGVTNFTHGQTSMSISPPASKSSTPEIPETWHGMTYNQLTAFDQHRGMMSPAQKNAHTKAKNARRPQP
jgi:hypothetical protein